MDTAAAATAWFAGDGLSAQDRKRCDGVAARLYPNFGVFPVEEQGKCSYTVRLEAKKKEEKFISSAVRDRNNDTDGEDDGDDDGANGDDDGANGDDPKIIIDSTPLLKILQFRPLCFDLDTAVVDMAKATYGAFAPSTMKLGSVHLSNHKDRYTLANGSCPLLNIYEIEYISGIPYSLYCRRQEPIISYGLRLDRQIRLVREFAAFVASAWPVSASPSASSPIPASASSSSTSFSSSPLFSSTPRSTPLTGNVGSRILPKLIQLSHSLPSSPLRSIARHAARSFRQLTQLLPNVLTHGDVLPTNIMVDAETGALRGLVDWAEAEILPFGLCLYGLEYLLGRFVGGGGGSNAEDANPSVAGASCGNGEEEGEEEGEESVGKEQGIPRFVYHQAEQQLRGAFWAHLVDLIPPLQRDAEGRFEKVKAAAVRDAIMMARNIGVLLWFGFAWDDGRIDRVVNSTDDPSEVHCLKMFLLREESYSQRSASV